MDFLSTVIHRLKKIENDPLSSKDVRKVQLILEQMVSLHYIPKPPSGNDDINVEKNRYLQILWDRLVARFNKPLIEAMDGLREERKESANETSFKTLCKIHTNIENEFEKRLDSQPVFQMKPDTRTSNSFQKHPSDIAYETIEMSLSEMENDAKLMDGEGRKVDLTKEISLKVTEGEKRLGNNKEKLFLYDNNPFNFFY